MKLLYNKAKNCFSFLVLLFSFSNLFSQVGTQTFVHTGSAQTFTVPACVYQVTLNLWGAQGGQAIDQTPANGPGGLGGWASGVLTVTPGQVLNVMVGGRGFTTAVGGF